MRVSVVIPALNEAGNIGRLIEETYAVVPAEVLAEVIVVDDCSEDTTGDRDQDADRARDVARAQVSSPQPAERPERGYADRHPGSDQPCDCDHGR